MLITLRHPCILAYRRDDNATGRERAEGPQLGTIYVTKTKGYAYRGITHPVTIRRALALVYIIVLEYIR